MKRSPYFPYDTSSWINDFFLGSVFSTIRFYIKNPPISSNLYEIPKNIKIGDSLNLLKKHWEAEQSTKTPRFFRAMMKTIRKDYILDVIITIIGQLQFLPQAILTNYLIDYLMNPSAPEYEGIFLTFAIIFSIVLNSCTKTNGSYRILVLTGKVKNMIAIMISERVLDY